MNPRVFLLPAVWVCCLAAQPNADLAQVQSVYVMPMSGGMHQHLTNRLIKLGLFQIVADPQRADSVLTDKLGGAFEAQLSEWDAEAARRAPKPLTPPAPAPVAGVPPPADAPAKAEGSDPAPLELASRQITTAISRSKGTLFLVDRRSRRVLWSTYQKTKTNQPDDLEKAAARIADRVKEDWGAKKK